MIDERALCARMKEAWRESGYEAAGIGDDMLLFSGYWAVLMPRRIMPRKALALLVEHIGDIPEGRSYRVSKGRGAQTELIDVAIGHKEYVLSLKKEVTQRAEKTEMEWRGCEVWQIKETLGILLVDAGYTALSTTDEDWRAKGSSMVAEDEGGIIVAMQKNAGKMMPEQIRALLEKTMLTGE